MKSIATLLSLIAFAATCDIATAQTTSSTTDNNQAATAASSTAPAASPAAQPESSAPVVAAAAPAEAAPTVAVAAVPPAPQADATPAPAAAPATATAPATSSDAGTNAAAAPHDPNAVIPLIVMDEVVLTDAIKNLARQASLNYMLDPKISYGTPDANGVVHQAPTISLRWENLTADQALNAVLKTYNLQIIDDPRTHIALITMKDPAAPDPLSTKIVQLKYAASSNMVTAVSSILTDKRSKVIGDNRTSQLVIIATEKEIVSIDELVGRLDTTTREVLIEARIVETSKNPTTSKGVDWSGTLQAQHVNFGNGSAYLLPPTAPTASNPGVAPSFSTLTVPNSGGATTNILNTGSQPSAGVPGFSGLVSQVLSPGTIPMIQANSKSGFNPSTFFLNADGVSAVLSFLNENFDGTVLSTPRAVTLDNEEATLSVTTAQPIFLTTAGTQGSPGGSQVIYTNLGTILKVTPRISANSTISLKVIPEVSDIAGTVTKTVAGLVNQADVYDIRRIETSVLIPSGNTLVMGGLVDDNRSKSSTKVPVLGDLPLLGTAFRSSTKTQNKKNLIIFITPTIVQNEDFQPTETAFLKTKVPDMKASDFGAWDSTEPQDWSKLAKKSDKTADSDAVWPTTK